MADYSRQLSLQWMNESRQASIIQSRVLIFGAGGLGVTAVSYLAGAGVGTITLVDQDRIEASNLHRQTIYRVADIGQYKAKVAASYISERNPNCAMSGLTEFLDLQSLRELFEQHDLVLAGFQSSLQGRLLHCDFLSYEFSAFDVPKNKTCCHGLSDLDLESDFDLYLASHVPRIDRALCASNILIDIRSKIEVRDEPSAFSALHIEALKLGENPHKFLEKNLQYLLLCSSGKRSKKLCNDLLKTGYEVTACRLH